MHASEVQQLIDRLDGLRGAADARVLVAIAGAPGSGKSTLAGELVAALQARDGDAAAALMPMDGFHMDNPELDAKGLRAVKGAAHTFDASGFVELVRQVRAGGRDLHYPLFDRARDCTVPNAGQLLAATPVVVFEGNYLLLRHAPWSDLAPMFDLTVMLSVPLPVLRARLVDRWLGYDLSLHDAAARADGNDMVNARFIVENSAPADLQLAHPLDTPVADDAEHRHVHS